MAYKLKIETGEQVPLTGSVKYYSDGGLIGFDQIPIGGGDLASANISGSDYIEIEADGYYTMGFNTWQLAGDTTVRLYRKPSLTLSLGIGVVIGLALFAFSKRKRV